MNKRERLLQLVEILKLPYLPEEVEGWVKNLDDEDVALLVSIYEDILNYKNNLDALAKKNNPEEYEKLKREYEEKLKNIDNEYTKQIEEIETDTDKKLDALYDENQKGLDDKLSKLSIQIKEAEKTHENLYSHLENLTNQDQKSPQV